MSWWHIQPPKDDPERVARNRQVARDVSTALIELRRTMHTAHATRVMHFEPVLAEVNDALKLMGD